MSVFQPGRTRQILNIQNIANDTGISQATAKECISLLEASYIIYRLAAFLIYINDHSQIETHPLKGNLYETMKLSELIKNRVNRGMINNLLFYRDSNGNGVVVIHSGDIIRKQSGIQITNLRSLENHIKEDY